MVEIRSHHHAIEKNYHAAITENFPQLPIETCEPLYEGWAKKKNAFKE